MENIINSVRNLAAVVFEHAEVAAAVAVAVIVVVVLIERADRRRK